MKKCWVLVLFAVLLTGCSAAETFETVDDELLQQVLAPVGELTMAFPEDAALEVMENGEGTLYLCRDYTMTVQTLPSGDLKETVRSISGFDPDDLTIMQTTAENVKRYDWVWTAVGEGGDQICRAAVLDDGNYHYCVTAMAQAQTAGTLGEEWSAIFASLALS